VARLGVHEGRWRDSSRRAGWESAVTRLAYTHTVISSATRDVIISFDRPFTIIGSASTNRAEAQRRR
jgi:hypothetical protein